MTDTSLSERRVVCLALERLGCPVAMCFLITISAVCHHTPHALPVGTGGREDGGGEGLGFSGRVNLGDGCEQNLSTWADDSVSCFDILFS